MKVTEAILDVLRDEGIRHLFCVPGGTIDPLLESLANQTSVRPIVCAHEGGAAFMADGYARASARFGAYAVISGPGFTNTISALTTAFTDQVPLLALSGEVNTDWEGRGSFQDSSSAGVRSMDIAGSITALQLHLPKPSLTYHHMARLLRNMLSHSCRGPVHLSIPADVQRAEVPGDWAQLPRVLYQPRFVDINGCSEFWGRVGTHSKVAIFAGSGCVHSEASAELISFAERFEIPVATTMPAKGVFPEDHPLSLGVMGWFGHTPAIEALSSGQLEVLFVMGSRLNMLDTMVWSPAFRPRKALILNDINTHSVFRDFRVELPILGDARTCLETLNASASELGVHLQASRPARRQWIASLKNGGTLVDAPDHCRSDLCPIHPARAIADLRQVMPRTTMLFADSGAHGFFAAHYWKAYEPRRFFSSIKYMGSMGWAIPAAIGAKLAQPELPCAVVTGDGCMLMHGVEIQTAARYRIPLVCVILNNSALGNPKLRADKIGPAVSSLHELPTHDWAMFARSLGAHGITVTDPDELVPAFTQALGANATVVVDVRVGNYPTPTQRFDLEMGRDHRSLPLATANF
jgi:acetolactate synthase I/II/III large subunit